MNITQTLNRTAGRFTTLVVNKGATNNTFCAQITSATDKNVRFYDVNAEANRVVPTALGSIRQIWARFNTASRESK